VLKKGVHFTIGGETLLFYKMSDHRSNFNQKKSVQ